ncbi:2-methoxy-6-polyprenyl-1,4-benzoquinol methylase [subsurface metagenome]
MRLPLSVKDKSRAGVFKDWIPEKRPEKWLVHLPADVVKDTNPKGKIVLDAGTGKGRFAIAFAKGGAERVIAVDISPVMLKLAREEAEKEGVLDKISFEIGDVESLKYPDNHFDIACCMATTMHLPYPSKAISELKRVCKVGGLVVVDASINEKPKQGDYWKSFTEDEFLKLFDENGLKIERKRRYSMEGVETSTITVIARKQKP